MRTETLKIIQNDQTIDTPQLVQLLKSQSGVRDVMLIAAKNECSVFFDEHKITSEQLQAALKTIGIESEIGKISKGACCGSCGG
jgi:hypothetical protein